MLHVEITQAARGNVGYCASSKAPEDRALPGILQADGITFVSETPNGAGEAESINNAMRRLIQATR